MVCEVFTLQFEGKLRIVVKLKTSVMWLKY